MQLLSEETYALVEWVEEGSLSVVCCKKIDGGIWGVGEVHRIKTASGIFERLHKNSIFVQITD